LVSYKHIEYPPKIKYKYSIYNKEENHTVWEREPTRELVILDPNNYTGNLSIERSN